MAIKLGTSSVTLKLGTQSVTGYLGSAIVTATVPGAPTNVSAEYFAGAAATEVSWTDPQDDGGSSITGRVFYFDGVAVVPEELGQSEAQFFTDYSGASVEVAAVNAIGEGPKSAPVTVT